MTSNRNQSLVQSSIHPECLCECFQNGINHPTESSKTISWPLNGRMGNHPTETSNTLNVSANVSLNTKKASNPRLKVAVIRASLSGLILAAFLTTDN